MTQTKARMGKNNDYADEESLINQINYITGKLVTINFN